MLGFVGSSSCKGEVCELKLTLKGRHWKIEGRCQNNENKLKQEREFLTSCQYSDDTGYHRVRSGVDVWFTASLPAYRVHPRSSESSGEKNDSILAAQKLNLSASPHRKKRYSLEEGDGTGFCGALQRTPPPVPPALLRKIGVKEVTGVGKSRMKLCNCMDGHYKQCPNELPEKLPKTNKRPTSRYLDCSDSGWRMKFRKGRRCSIPDETCPLSLHTCHWHLSMPEKFHFSPSPQARKVVHYKWLDRHRVSRSGPEA
ncbi:unnamed protein product [Phaedon cochleariae]|uniref:Uncharacterized protein n=1 Tax=Phaedon cochleariae TaxID=80249 RepID=A0A9N9SEN4_PHACE|nr:unnamed protein product [Phaedon cochleariae]